MFKNGIQDTVKANVPSKKINGRPNLPWITDKIKCTMRKRNVQYHKGKKDKSSSSWHKYILLQKSIRREVEKEHSHFLNEIVNDAIKDNPKQMWRYIKAK